MKDNVFDRYRLFLAKISFDSVILAKDEEEAKRIFRSKRSEMISDAGGFINCPLERIEDIESLPYDWRGCYPYSGSNIYPHPRDGDEHKIHELTCKVFMDNLALRKKELARLKEIEAINREEEKKQTKFSFYNGLEENPKMTLTK